MRSLRATHDGVATRQSRERSGRLLIDSRGLETLVCRIFVVVEVKDRASGGEKDGQTLRALQPSALARRLVLLDDAALCSTLLDSLLQHVAVPTIQEVLLRKAIRLQL